jgi:hypothetical protein
MHFITQHHIIKEYQKQTCLESKTRFYKILVAILILLGTRVFQARQSQQHFILIKHAGVHIGQSTHSAHLQIDNNLMNPTKLDSPQNNLWLNFYELINRTMTRTPK